MLSGWPGSSSRTRGAAWVRRQVAEGPLGVGREAGGAGFGGWYQSSATSITLLMPRLPGRCGHRTDRRPKHAVRRPLEPAGDRARSAGVKWVWISAARYRGPGWSRSLSARARFPCGCPGRRPSISRSEDRSPGLVVWDAITSWARPRGSVTPVTVLRNRVRSRAEAPPPDPPCRPGRDRCCEEEEADVQTAMEPAARLRRTQRETAARASAMRRGPPEGGRSGIPMENRWALRCRSVMWCSSSFRSGPGRWQPDLQRRSGRGSRSVSMRPTTRRRLSRSPTPAHGAEPSALDHAALLPRLCGLNGSRTRPVETWVGIVCSGEVAGFLCMAGAWPGR